MTSGKVAVTSERRSFLSVFPAKLGRLWASYSALLCAFRHFSSSDYSLMHPHVVSAQIIQPPSTSLRFEGLTQSGWICCLVQTL